ncbi:MAG TPA: hypothetical protein VF331_08325 [Polyangiales bacterium]
MTLGAHDPGRTCPSPTPARRDPGQDRIFKVCTLVLLGLCLWPVWACAALPMQDYPQHLFIASVLQGDGAHIWSRYYEWQLHLEPYSGCYWVLRLLGPVFGLDTAGRLLVSAYFVLLAGFVASAARRFAHTPWGLLLVLPWATHQEYFHGLLNYLIALPLLLIALEQLRAAATARWTALQLCGHMGLLLVILLFHPFCVLAYVGMAVCEAALTRSSATLARMRLLPACLASTLLVLWQVFCYRSTNSQLHWLGPEVALHYLRQIFSGMRASHGATWHAVVWLGLLAALASARRTNVLDRRDVLRLLGLLTACFFLPFWVGRYSYFNLRVAALVYFQLAAMAGCFALGRAARSVVVASALALTLDASLLQAQVARESAEILPLVAKLAPERKVASVAFDDTSAYLDPECFPELHRHEVFYYQLQKGGLSPHLWHLPLVPVRYKASVRLAEPHSVRDLLAQGYQLVFARNAPPKFTEIMLRHFQLRAHHGTWLVFERQP